MEIFEKMLAQEMTKTEIRPDCVPFREAEWAVEKMKQEGHKKLYFIYHPDIKLKAVIAIHDKTLGEQALGGIRMLPYSSETNMILDVLRLSKAMTYKAAMAGMRKGGAKCVIWGDPRIDKSHGLLWKLADEIEALAGEYIGGEDMNIDENDVRIMRMRTSYVAGLPKTFSHGRYRGGGNPAPVTAQGIVYGMKACLKFLGMGSLAGKTVAIQGLGQVGHRLARSLYQEGVKQIIATDIDPRRMAHFEEEFREKALWEFRELARAVNPEEIFSQECDIFAPCASGGAINTATADVLRCKIVAGAANNQLEAARHGKRLMERGILYAPDYIINAGGLINVDDERHPDGYNELRVQAKLENIFSNLMRVFWYSRRLGLPTNEIADMLAEERIQVEGLCE